MTSIVQRFVFSFFVLSVAAAGVAGCSKPAARPLEVDARTRAAIEHMKLLAELRALGQSTQAQTAQSEPVRPTPERAEPVIVEEYRRGPFDRRLWSDGVEETRVPDARIYARSGMEPGEWMRTSEFTRKNKAGAEQQVGDWKDRSAIELGRTLRTPSCHWLQRDCR